MMRTNAPRGRARTPYSVSPAAEAPQTGAEAEEELGGLHPGHRAVTKWPISWRKTDTRMPTTKTNIHRLTTASQASRPRMAMPAIADRTTPSGRRPSSSAPSVDRPAGHDLVAEAVVAALRSAIAAGLHRSLDRPRTSCGGDRRPPDRPRRRRRRSSASPSCRSRRRCTRRRSDPSGSPGEERLDGDLVGGAEPRRGGAAGPSGLVGEGEAAERGRSGGSKSRRRARPSRCARTGCRSAAGSRGRSRSAGACRAG